MEVTSRNRIPFFLLYFNVLFHIVSEIIFLLQSSFKTITSPNSGWATFQWIFPFEREVFLKICFPSRLDWVGWARKKVVKRSFFLIFCKFPLSLLILTPRSVSIQLWLHLFIDIPVGKFFLQLTTSRGLIFISPLGS